MSSLVCYDILLPEYQTECNQQVCGLTVQNFIINPAYRLELTQEQEYITWTGDNREIL